MDGPFAALRTQEDTAKDDHLGSQVLDYSDQYTAPACIEVLPINQGGASEDPGLRMLLACFFGFGLSGPRQGPCCEQAPGARRTGRWRLCTGSSRVTFSRAEAALAFSVDNFRRLGPRCPAAARTAPKDGPLA